MTSRHAVCVERGSTSSSAASDCGVVLVVTFLALEATMTEVITFSNLNDVETSVPCTCLTDAD